MTRPDAFNVLLSAFARLPPDQLRLLKRRARAGVPIACGMYASDYVSPKGFG